MWFRRRGSNKGKQGTFGAVLAQGVTPSGRAYVSHCSRNAVEKLSFEKVLSHDPTSASAGGASGDGGPDAFSGCASCLKFNNSGTKLASATSDCKVLVYDVESGLCESEILGHSEIITGLAWLKSADESSFYTTSLDKTIRLWRGTRAVATYVDHADWIRCVGIAKDDRTLASGCVSSNIFVRDVETGRTKMRIKAMEGLLDGTGGPITGGNPAAAPNHHQQQQPSGGDAAGVGAGVPRRRSASFCTSFEYSINSLDFYHTSHDVFVGGIRNGTVRVWDARDARGRAISTLHAHDAKLNQVQIGQHDSTLLTAGRDSVIRLWETRMFGTGGVATEASRSLLVEYKGHKCQSYNISCTFFCNDKAVVTGSEDSTLWVYSAETGAVVKTLPGHDAVVHFITAPSNDARTLRLASSSIDSNRVRVWQVQAGEGDGEGGGAAHAAAHNAAALGRVRSTESHTNAGMHEGVGDGAGANASADPQGGHGQSWGASREPAPMTLDTIAAELRRSRDVNQMHRSAIETLMRKHGDLILRIFHMYDYSFRAPFDWRALIEHVQTLANETGPLDQHSRTQQETLIDELNSFADLRSQLGFDSFSSQDGGWSFTSSQAWDSFTQPPANAGTQIHDIRR